MDDHPRTAELQGLYGPLQILEGRVQQVWALQQLQGGGWKTRDGRFLRVRSPGRWNRGAGPDFQEAVLELDGEAMSGDVEIHLYREDWWRHGHDVDPAYDRVVLHVVLFAGGMERRVETASGRVPAEFTLGPWLREDLESVSGGEPGLFGELVPELREWMESDEAPVIRGRLRLGSDRRWQDKESMARCLYEAAGWQGALHRMVLYYLGFPFNRRAFFEMAEACPPADWRDPGLFEFLRRRWNADVRWGIGRPANQAGTRLKQYLSLNRHVPDWTGRLRQVPGALRKALLAELGARGMEAETTGIRRRAGFTRWRKWLNGEILGGQGNTSLADRLWVDVFLPMLVVDGQLGREPAFALWFHGHPGSYPDAYRELLKLAGIQVETRLPLCNGWIQGMLWLEDQLRLERVRSTSGAHRRA
ncbi:MAG: DUF2851 family protein, partial [Oceanipulchritudo sp.]